MSKQIRDALTGICSVCEGRFVVHGNVPVLHGYKRPGRGYIHGNCDGMKFPAYEISTAGVVWLRDGLLAQLARHQNFLGRLQAGQITSIVRTLNKRDKTTVVLTPNSSVEDFRKVGLYGGWPGLIERSIHWEQGEIKSFTAEIARQNSRIDSWKPGVAFILESTLFEADKKVRQAARDAAEFKRNCKRNKSLFFHIGSAISRHKKGQRNSNEWVKPGDIDRNGQPWIFLPEFKEMYPNLKKGKK